MEMERFQQSDQRKHEFFAHNRCEWQYPVRIDGWDRWNRRAIDPDGNEIARGTNIGPVLSSIALVETGEILTGSTYNRAYSLTLDSVFSRIGTIVHPMWYSDLLSVPMAVQLFPSKDGSLYAFNPADGTADSVGPSICIARRVARLWLERMDWSMPVRRIPTLFVIDPSGGGSVKSETVISSQSGLADNSGRLQWRKTVRCISPVKTGTFIPTSKEVVSRYVDG